MAYYTISYEHIIILVNKLHRLKDITIENYYGKYVDIIVGYTCPILEFSTTKNSISDQRGETGCLKLGATLHVQMNHHVHKFSNTPSSKMTTSQQIHNVNFKHLRPEYAFVLMTPKMMSCSYPPYFFKSWQFGRKPNPCSQLLV